MADETELLRLGKGTPQMILINENMSDVKCTGSKGMKMFLGIRGPVQNNKLRKKW